METDKKTGRGGARANAGRKPNPSLKIQIRIKLDEMDKIKGAAEKEGITPAAFVKNAVMEKV